MPSTPPPSNITQRIDRLAHQALKSHDDRPPCPGTRLGVSAPRRQTRAQAGCGAPLPGRFSGVYGTETIERFLDSSFDQFAGRATVTQVPAPARRTLRQAAHALARVEGLHDDGKPVVLSLCTHNAGRSQMALGFFQALAGDNAVAWSGGSGPGLEVNPVAVQAMAERGIDIAHEFPKPGPMRPRPRRRRRHLR